MRDARDAEDALLLQTGDHATLIAAWYPVIQQRCLARAGDAGWDVAHQVVERLLTELQRGRTYAVPYRVVVHNVVTWTLKEHWQELPTDAPLPDDWSPEALEDGYVRVEQDYDLDALFGELNAGDRAVCELRYREGLEVAEIADRLGKDPNAVSQALWRAHRSLERLIGAG
jgi:RNA polymerase sigma factor (sigma-70 family)